MKKAAKTYYPRTLTAWRNWLEKHHLSEQAVWVVFYNKKSAKKSITWSEAVDMALCFGWIDSKKIKIDEETAHHFFSRRKPKSTWSKINKLKIMKLLDLGLMAPAGLEAVEKAKQNGSWEMLDAVEELFIPPDLETALQAQQGSTAGFLSLSRSVRKALLQRLVMTKRPETREKHIASIVELAAVKRGPNIL